MPRPHGITVSPEDRERGLQMLRDGATGPEVQLALNVGDSTVARWRAMLRAAKPKAKVRTKSKTKSKAKNKPGLHVSGDLRQRGLALVRSGAARREIAKALGVSHTTVRRWTVMTKSEKGAAKSAQPATAFAAKVARPQKAKVRSTQRQQPLPTQTYFNQQIAEVGRVIRASMPDLMFFSMTSTDDGQTDIQYAVRQTTELTGVFKL